MIFFKFKTFWLCHGTKAICIWQTSVTISLECFSKLEVHGMWAITCHSLLFSLPPTQEAEVSYVIIRVEVNGTQSTLMPRFIFIIYELYITYTIYTQYVLYNIYTLMPRFIYDIHTLYISNIYANIEQIIWTLSSLLKRSKIPAVLFLPNYRLT